MALCYMAILMRLRSVCKSQSQSMADHEQEQFQRELLLMLQAAIICSILFLENICFWFLPYMFPGPYTPIVTMWIFIANSSINPVVYWIFNSNIRQEVLKLFHKLFGVPTTVVQEIGGTTGRGTGGSKLKPVNQDVLAVVHA